MMFKYVAIQPSGEEIEGVLEASSLAEAKARLMKKNVIITHLKKHKSKKNKSLGYPVLLGFTRDVGQLLRAGLPLYDALLSIAEKYTRYPVFIDICEQVKEGRALSDVLSDYPEIFDRIYVALVRSGESMGNLEMVFTHLARLISKKYSFQRKVRAAVLYPAFLFTFCFVIIIALFAFVIPSMRDLFTDRTLHPFTQAVLSLSDWVENNGWSLAYGFLGVLVSAQVVQKIGRAKRWVQSVWLRLPILKTVLTEVILTRFSLAMGSLLSQGVPLIEALRLSRDVMNHPSFESVIAKAEEELLQGKALSQELNNSELFPALVRRMVATGEESGTLADSFQYIAEIYEEETEQSLSQFTTFIQPALLLLLGGLVGTVILAILLPLTDVSSLV